MRKENKRMLAVVLSAVCVLTAAGMDGSISVASTETRQTDSIEKTQTISSALASALEQIPEVAAVAVSTQEWHQKAVSNVDGETDVLLAGEEGSESRWKTIPQHNCRCGRKRGCMDKSFRR